MKITEISIHKPIFTIMMITTLVVLGAAAYLRLGIELMPNVEFPYVMIQTSLRGAGPPTTLPCASNFEPWQGHMNPAGPSPTIQPRCVHTSDMAATP